VALQLKPSFALSRGVELPLSEANYAVGLLLHDSTVYIDNEVDPVCSWEPLNWPTLQLQLRSSTAAAAPCSALLGSLHP
jgi:hypothetical protein